MNPIDALNKLCDAAEDGGMDSVEVDALKAIVRSVMEEKHDRC